MFASIWVRMAFPVVAFGSAMHDDQLFVRLAAEIGMGNWLGDYSNLTHAKGVGYSLFLLINHAIGLPLKFSEHSLYLIAALFFSSVVFRISRSQVAAWLVFVVLAFSPVAWLAGATGRVMREGLYTPQALAILAFGLFCWVAPHMQSDSRLDTESRSVNWKNLFAFGVVTGWFWLTREEGVWLMPAMLVMAAYSLWSVRNMPRRWFATVFNLALPVFVAIIVVGGINFANYAVYGVFRNNDFRSGDFQAAYGALSRIRHENWQRYIVFPSDAREKAYAMSSAARELRPFFEGAAGDNWRKIGCEQTGYSPCPDILSGWFMWAFRDAVANAGYYRNAQTASRFYWQLASEINQGCAREPSACLPPRETLVPPWREEYLRDTVLGTYWIYRTLTTFNMESPGSFPSSGSPIQLRLFALVTNGPLAPTKEESQSEAQLVSPRDTIRFRIATVVTEWQRTFLSYGLPAAIIGWMIWMLVACYRRCFMAPLVMVTALMAAVMTRMVLLGFLEISSIPSNNLLYLSPAIPMALALPVIMGWAALRKIHWLPVFGYMRQWVLRKENRSTVK